MTVPFAVKDSPRTGWLPDRGGQASQCWPGCAFQITISVERMSCECRIDVCRALLVFGLV